MENTATNNDEIAREPEAEKDNVGAVDEVAAEAAEAEVKDDKTAPATGKFKSVEALMSAYLSLEAEFTRRSQRLKELEEKGRASDDDILAAALANDNVRKAVVGDYLKSLSAVKSVPLLVDGAPCVAPAAAPTTLKEAGMLAKQFLNN